MTNVEIQVGEYVRSDEGFIAKVKTVNDDYIECDSTIISHYGDFFDDIYGDDLNSIAKHSFNIIDLIEVGDYVNGYLVKAIDYDEDENGNLFNVLGVVLTEDDFAYREGLENINIHSIVTKEQFKAMEYKVGGKE